MVCWAVHEWLTRLVLHDMALAQVFWHVKPTSLIVYLEIWNKELSLRAYLPSSLDTGVQVLFIKRWHVWIGSTNVLYRIMVLATDVRCILECLDRTLPMVICVVVIIFLPGRDLHRYGHVQAIDTIVWELAGLADLLRSLIEIVVIDAAADSKTLGADLPGLYAGQRGYWIEPHTVLPLVALLTHPLTEVKRFFFGVLLFHWT